MKTINKNIIFATENIIAHGCNCQGKMGSGVAKAIRARWPAAYTQYKGYYDSRSNGLPLGLAQIVAVEFSNNTATKFIANCMTQQYYGKDGKVYASLEAIKSSLTEVADFASKYNYSVALPPIGCGLGGLNWKEVGPIVEKIFDDAGVEFQVYDYQAENWRR